MYQRTYKINTETVDNYAELWYYNNGKRIEHRYNHTPLISGVSVSERSVFIMQKFKAIKYIRLSYADDKSVESNSVSNQRKLIDDFISCIIGDFDIPIKHEDN